jgi:hypothetical protein
MISSRRRGLLAAVGVVVALIAGLVGIGVLGPSKVQASPRAMLDTAEIACAKQKDFTGCVLDVFEGFDTDWADAAEELLTRSSRRAVSPYQIFCHLIAHDLGVRAARDGAPQLGTWALRCEGGYIHGLMSVEFEDVGPDTLVAEALQWCRTVGTPGVMYSCAHLLGHELWERAGGDVNLLDKCTNVSHPDPASRAEQQDRLVSLCRGGVFMEYYQAADKQQRWIAEGERALTADLLAPCLAIDASSGRDECFGVAYPALVLTSPASDPIGKGRDGLARCSELDPADQGNCVIGVIAITTTNAPRGTEQTLPMCALVPAAQADCYRQLAVTYLTDAQDLPAAERVCTSQGSVDVAGCLAFVRGWYERNLSPGDLEGHASVPAAALR